MEVLLALVAFLEIAPEEVMIYAQLENRANDLQTGLTPGVGQRVFKISREGAEITFEKTYLRHSGQDGCAARQKDYTCQAHGEIL